MPALRRNVLACGTVGFGAACCLTAATFAEGVTGPPVVGLSWDCTADDGAGIGTESYAVSDISPIAENVGGNVWRYASSANIWNPDGTADLSDDLQGNQGVWSMGWEVLADADPFVQANLAITNNTDFYQTFQALVTVNIAPPVGPGYNMRGSVSASVTDTTFPGGFAEIRSTPAGDPVYAGLVDGVTQRTLLDAPFSLTTATSTSTSSQFGSPAFEFNPGTANNTISVWLRVELSPRDQVNLIGIFEVLDVPAPGAMALLGLAGLVGGRRRRA